MKFAPLPSVFPEYEIFGVRTEAGSYVISCNKDDETWGASFSPLIGLVRYIGEDLASRREAEQACEAHYAKQKN